MIPVERLVGYLKGATCEAVSEAGARAVSMLVARAVSKAVGSPVNRDVYVTVYWDTNEAVKSIIQTEEGRWQTR